MELEEKSAAAPVRSRGRKLLSLVLFTLTVIFTLSLFFGFDNFSSSPYVPKKSSFATWSSITPDPNVLQSKHLGGLPGYQVIENVWVHDGTIYMFSSDRRTLPSKSRSVTGKTGWEVFTHPNEERVQLAKNALVLPGTTLFVNDGAKEDEWHYLSSYYHIIGEIFLGSVASLASIPSKSSIPMERARSGVEVPSAFDRMIIPWKGATDWRDDEGLGEMVLNGLFGENLLEPADWEALSQLDNKHNGWVYLERVVITDRWASHRHNSLSESLNKMAASVFSLPHPPFFLVPSRQSLFTNLSIPLPLDRPEPARPLRPLPKIVYVDRQGSNRRLTEESHAHLAVVLGELEARGLATVGHKKMETLGHAEQVAAVSDADIVIGVHDEILTHQLWMPEGGVVIELFPPESFLPENQIVADVLNHQYIPVWHHIALSREEWEALPRQHGHYALYDGTQVTVDRVFMRLLLEELISRMTAP